MSPAGASASEHRVLVLAPTGKDAMLTATVFERAGLAYLLCSDMTSLCAELELGAAAVLMAEESVQHDGQDPLAAWLSRQPPWSDLPLLVLARQGADSSTVSRAMDLLGNVTVLERPTRIASLVSAIRSALRARQRQYQIREHLAERDQTAEELREASRRKDEFLAILAHELRNPLAPIRNALEILKLTARGNKELLMIGAMMERQVNHMVRLVDDLLEVSRITRGAIELRVERVRLDQIVHNAVETSRPLIDDGAHQLTIDLPGEPIWLDGDPVRLAQIFANLLNNAAKYTGRGGEISLVARQEGGEALVSVRDNGAGIPPQMLQRIFELFTQVERGSELSRGGLGIGLTLVKSLVELHHGTVEAFSEGRGRGTEFLIRLPLAPQVTLREPPQTAAMTTG